MNEDVEIEMTDERAIDVIVENCYDMNVNDLDHANMVNEALNVAIKALEMKPSSNCKSVSDILEIARKHFDPNDVTGRTMLNVIEEIVNKAPDVRCNEREGKWIIKISKNNKQELICDECGHVHFSDYNDIPKYCSECGMRNRMDFGK